MRRIHFLPIIIVLFWITPKVVAQTFSRPITIQEWNSSGLVRSDTVPFSFKVIDSHKKHVSVVAPNGTNWDGHTKPYGNIYIPSIVQYDSVSYVVCEIGDYAFAGCDSIQRVYKTNTLTRIGREAFRDCKSLKKIYFSDSIKTIGERAFAGCSKLHYVEIPTTATAIGTGAFTGVRNINYNGNATGRPWGADVCQADENGLYYLDDGKTVVVGSQQNLEKVAIPKGVKTIASYAFLGRTQLRSVSIPPSITYIGDAAFYGCTHVKQFKLPKHLQHIGEQAFAHCTAITSIEIPRDVVYIGSYAFSNDSNLSTVYYNAEHCADPDSTFLMHFFYGSPVKKLVIGNHVTRIPDMMFASTPLEDLRIPKSVTRIGNYAFLACGFTRSITIPATVNVIGKDAFGGWFTGPASYNIIYDGIATGAPWGAQTFGRLYEKDNLIYEDEAMTHLVDFKPGIKHLIIPTNVKTIKRKLFKNCQSIEDAVILCDIDTLPYELFYNCHNLKTIDIRGKVKVIDRYFCNDTNLVSIVLPEGLISIEEDAFGFCNRLSSVRLPSTIVSIDDYALCPIHAMTSVEIPRGIQSIGAAAIGGASLKTIYYNADSCTIKQNNWIGHPHSAFICGKQGTDIQIGSHVKKIPANFLAYAKRFRITIPETIEEIEEQAFYNTFIDTLRVPSRVKKIGKNAFYKVYNVEYHGTATGAPWGAFALNGKPVYYERDGLYYADSTMTSLVAVRHDIDSVVLPASVTSINNAFKGHENIRHVTITNPIEDLSGAFVKCSNLESISLPEGVKILKGTFHKCNHLRNIALPRSVTNICNAFEDCNSLDSIFLPDGITVMDSAFMGCIKLRIVNIPPKIATLTAGTFSYCLGLRTFTLPPTIKEIKFLAFDECRNLTLTVSDSTLLIEDSAFFNVANVIYHGPAEPEHLVNWGAQLWNGQK